MEHSTCKYLAVDLHHEQTDVLHHDKLCQALREITVQAALTNKQALLCHSNTWTVME